MTLLKARLTKQEAEERAKSINNGGNLVKAIVQPYKRKYAVFIETVKK